MLPGALSVQDCGVGVGVTDVNVTCPRLFSATFEEVSLTEILSVETVVDEMVNVACPEESRVAEVGLKTAELLLESEKVTLSPDSGLPEMSCRVTVTVMVVCPSAGA